MQESGGPHRRRVGPSRRAGSRAALAGLLLFIGTAAWVWFAGHAAPSDGVHRATADPPLPSVASGGPDAPARAAVPTGRPATTAPSPSRPAAGIAASDTGPSTQATGRTAPEPMNRVTAMTAPVVAAPVVAAPVVAAPVVTAPAMTATAGAGRAQPAAPARPGPDLPPALPAAAVRPSFDIARITARGDAVLAGRAAPDAMVTITSDGRAVAQVRADRAGQWVALPSAALPAGPSELLLSARAPTDAAVVTAAETLLIVVPSTAHSTVAPPDPALGAAPGSVTGAPAPAVSDGAAPQPPAATLALLLPRDGPPRLLQKPTAEGATATPPGKPIAATLNLDQVDYSTGGAIRFAGTAHPGSAVRLYVDEIAIGQTVADLAGRWALEPAAAIAIGPHRVRVDEIGIRGEVLARIALPFERSAIAPEDALAGRVVVQPRQTLWRIARRAYGHGVQYTIIYEANREQIADPDRIYPGQIFSVPGPAAR